MQSATEFLNLVAHLFPGQRLPVVVGVGVVERVGVRGGINPVEEHIWKRLKDVEAILARLLATCLGRVLANVDEEPNECIDAVPINSPEVIPRIIPISWLEADEGALQVSDSFP